MKYEYNPQHEPLYVARTAEKLPIELLDGWIRQGYDDFEEDRDTRYMWLVHAIHECALQHYGDVVARKMMAELEEDA